MNPERPTEQRITDWLVDEAPRDLPDLVLAATFERTRTTAQVSVRPGWRTLILKPRTLTIVAGAGAIVALLIIGIALVPRPERSSVAAPPISPSASTSAVAPSPAATAAAVASAPARSLPTPGNVYGGYPPANPIVPLPSDASGMMGLLPDTLCDRPVKTKSEGLTSSSGPFRFRLPRTTADFFGGPVLQDALAAGDTGPGATPSGGAQVIAVLGHNGSVGGQPTQPCSMVGAVRIVGADPAKFEHAFLDSAFSPRYTYRDLAGRQVVLWGPFSGYDQRPECETKVAPASCQYNWTEYLYFTGDTVFFFDAIDDNWAESVMRTLPPAPGPAAAPPSIDDIPLNPAVSLPDDLKAMTALLPDTLCGQRVTTTTYQSPFFYLPSFLDPMVPNPVRQKAFERALGNSGMTYDRVLEATKTSVSVSSCFWLGVFRIRGADPAWFRQTILDSTFPSTDIGMRLLAGKKVEVVGPAGGEKDNGCVGPQWLRCQTFFDYFYFTGDAVFFFDARDDAWAAKILQTLP